MTSLTQLVTGKPRTITVELPDGREIDVEADTPENAAKAAKSFLDRELATKRIAGERIASPMFSGIDDAVRATVRGVPLIGGGMDEASAGLNTGFGYLGDYDKELAYQRQRDALYDQENPVGSTALQFAGSIGGTLAGLRAGGVPAMPASMGGKMAAGAGVGGVTGYIEGFTRGEGGFENRNKAGLDSAKWGAGLGGLAPVAGNLAGKAVNAVLGKGAGKEIAPTVEQIGQAKTAAYDAAKNSGLVLKPDTFNKTADDIVQKFVDDAVDADLQPKAAVLMKRLQEAKDKPLTLTDLDNLRKKAVRIAQKGEPDEAHFAGKMIEGIDDFIDNLTPEGVTSGKPAEAASMITKARELAKRQRKSDLIETAMSRAENAVAANYTTAGHQTALQQQFRKILDDPKKLRIYTPDEQKLIKAVAHGTGGQRALNWLRKINASNPFAVVGASMNPTIGVPAIIAGQAVKMGSARVTKNAARLAGETVRRGGPALAEDDRVPRTLAQMLMIQSGQGGEALNREAPLARFLGR